MPLKTLSQVVMSVLHFQIDNRGNRTFQMPKLAGGVTYPWITLNFGAGIS